MKTKAPSVPGELSAFVKGGGTVFHCDDGDWELRIESREDSEIGEELPARSVVIAENGSGDFLFLKESAGKVGPKVFVYWHEEERHEMFAKHVKDLIANSRAAAKGAAKGSQGKPGPAKAAENTFSLAQLEEALRSTNAVDRSTAMYEFKRSEFGVEALPVLRKALSDSFVSVVICAIECIAKLGPAAAASPAAGEVDGPGSLTLEYQLHRIGKRVWDYSGYPNCYSTCLDALVKLKLHRFVLGYVHSHIGLNNPDALIHSLEALRELNTTKSLDLLERAATFWMPELNMAQTKKVKAIVEGAKKQ